MPVILVLGPYRFFFYSNEGNPVKAPHIHVRSQNGEAKISLVEPYGVLLNASPIQREAFELSAFGIHWNELDEDISVQGLLAGNGDMTQTPRKVA